MMYRWDPEVALRLIEAERVTAFVGVPTQSWDLLESPSFSKYDTSSLAVIGGGGAPAPVRLVERVESLLRRGSAIIGYGMTETNAYGPGNESDTTPPIPPPPVEHGQPLLTWRSEMPVESECPWESVERYG